MKIQYYNWNSLKELFTALNSTCNYLVMRNFEKMRGDEFLMDGHEDIDFLCDNPELLIKTLYAFPRKFFNKKVQNYILFKGQMVKIDIRYVGDGYFDSKWQVDMLKNKIMNESGFWIMDSTNYYYSLIYHSILQKNFLTEEYKERLTWMGKQLGYEASDESTFLNCLKTMMNNRGYSFVYPKDGTIPNRFELLNMTVKGRFLWKIRKHLDIPKQHLYHIMLKLSAKRGGGRIS